MVPSRWVGLGPGSEEVARGKARAPVWLIPVGVKAGWWGWEMYSHLGPHCGMPRDGTTEIYGDPSLERAAVREERIQETDFNQSSCLFLSVAAA